MREEQNEPLEPEMELGEPIPDETLPMPPMASKRSILLAAVVVVVVVIMMTAIIIHSSASEKEIRSNAYDLLLDQGELPTGWMAIGYDGINDTLGRNVVDERTVKSYASAVWINGPVGGYNLTVQCTIYVFDNATSAHAAIINWTTMPDPYVISPFDFSPTLNGTIGDESYGKASDNRAEVVFREAGVIAWVYATGYDIRGPLMDHYVVDELISIAEVQGDKIDG